MSFIQAPDEEFEEYLRHLISEQCTGDRNEVSSVLRIIFLMYLYIVKEYKLKFIASDLLCYGLSSFDTLLLPVWFLTKLIAFLFSDGSVTRRNY